MAEADSRARLRTLASERGESLAALSRMLGRNGNYLQQWIGLGSPRALAERDRRALADYFGVEEAALGGPATRAGWRARRLDVAASAGPGAVNEGDLSLGAASVPPELARSLGLQPGRASIIRVRGDSMLPGVSDGDELLVDEAKCSPDAKGGVFVIRIAGALFVKRVRRGRAGLEVTSDNPAAGAVPVGEVEVVGKAVWQMRRL